MLSLLTALALLAAPAPLTVAMPPESGQEAGDATFAPDGRSVVINGQVRFALPSGKRLPELSEAASDSAEGPAAFSADGSRFAAVCEVIRTTAWRHVCLWKLPSAKALEPPGAEADAPWSLDAVQLAFSRDGRLLVADTIDGVRVVRADTLQDVRKFSGVHSSLASAADALAIAVPGAGIELHRLSNGKALAVLPRTDVDDQTRLAISADATLLLIRGGSGAELVQLPSGTSVAKLVGPGFVDDAVALPEHRFAVAWSKDDRLRLEIRDAHGRELRHVETSGSVMGIDPLGRWVATSPVQAMRQDPAPTFQLVPIPQQ